VKRRRTARRGRKTNAFTSQSGTGGGLTFKARKTSRSAYRKHLWDSTLYKEHYRSNAAVSFGISTNNNTTDLNVAAEIALKTGVNDFFIGAGGARSPDASVSLPLFNGNLIVRGGMIGMRICNNMDPVLANTSSLHGTILLLKTTKNFVPANIPGTVQHGWDPSLIQDFDTRIGRILYRKNFLLRDAEAAVVEYRLKCEKIDINDFFGSFNTYLWLVLVGNTDGIISHQLTGTKYWNLSFVGDSM